MTGARLIDAGDVAALLGVSARTFRRRRPTLEAAGFPAADLRLGRPRWRADLVSAWIAAGADPDKADPDMACARQEAIVAMRRRIASLADAGLARA